jgi:hypothetical protein
LDFSNGVMNGWEKMLVLIMTNSKAMMVFCMKNNIEVSELNKTSGGFAMVQQ